MKTLTKIEVLEEAKEYFGIENISNMILQNYIAKGLITRIRHFHEKGISGSVAIYPKNTPGMLYLIRMMQDRGMQLKEIRGYLRLLELDHEAIIDIKKIIEEDERYREDILFKEGITPEIKDYILENVPLKLLKLRKLKITRKEKLYKIIELRAYAELDYKEITNLIKNSNNLEALNKIEKALEDPEIPEIDDKNLDIPEIKVIYKEPVNKEVVFKKDGLIEVIDNQK